MIPVAARTFPDVASAVALAALLAPAAVIAARRVGKRLDPVEAVTVGIGAIAALLVLGGLVLSLVHGLGTVGWLALVLVADAVALLSTVERTRLARRLLLAALVTAAIGLTAGAVAISRVSASDQAHATRFTQLWLLPAPANRARVGIDNEERARVAYRLRVSAPAPTRALVDRPVALNSGQRWSASVQLPRTHRPVRVTAELYRPGDTTPYRTAHIWTARTR